MADATLDNLIRRWATLGVMFDAEPLDGTPDLERTLLDTARLSPRVARLFVMGATWLHTYADLVARHRLIRLIRDELQPEYRPVLGLLLDIAQQGTHPPRFSAVLAGLAPATEPRPLFDIERSSPSLRARAERRASDLSKKWNLWCESIEFKHDALRPAAWIMARNRHTPEQFIAKLCEA